ARPGDAGEDRLDGPSLPGVHDVRRAMGAADRGAGRRAVAPADGGRRRDGDDDRGRPEGGRTLEGGRCPRGVVSRGDRAGIGGILAPAPVFPPGTFHYASGGNTGAGNHLVEFLEESRRCVILAASSNEDRGLTSSRRPSFPRP